MLYVALLTQEGEGCDYSIGCGLKWIDISVAHSVKEALALLKDTIIGHPDDGYTEGYTGSYWDDKKLAKVRLLAVSNFYEVPVKAWYEEAEKEFLARMENRENDVERELYEKLKKKYG